MRLFATTLLLSSFIGGCAHDTQQTEARPLMLEAVTSFRGLEVSLISRDSQEHVNLREQALTEGGGAFCELKNPIGTHRLFVSPLLKTSRATRRDDRYGISYTGGDLIGFVAGEFVINDELLIDDIYVGAKGRLICKLMLLTKREDMLRSWANPADVIIRIHYETLRNVEGGVSFVFHNMREPTSTKTIEIDFLR